CELDAPAAAALEHVLHRAPPGLLFSVPLSPLSEFRVERAAEGGAAWGTWRVWGRDGGDYVLAIAPAGAHPPCPQLDRLAAQLAVLNANISSPPPSVSGLLRISPFTPSISLCSLSLCSSLSPEHSLRLCVAALSPLRDFFRRSDAAVDGEVAGSFPPPPPKGELSPDQKGHVERCLELEEDGAGPGWRAIKDQGKGGVSLWMKHTPPRRGLRTVALGRASCTLDCPALRAAGSYANGMSRRGGRLAREAGDPARLVVEDRGRHDWTMALVKRSPKPLRCREFVFRMVAFSETSTSSIVLAYHPPDVDPVIDYGTNLKCVRAVAKTLVRFKDVPGESGTCEMTMLQMLDARGRLPVFVVNWAVPRALAPVEDMKIEFARDDEIDAANLARRIQMIASHEGDGYEGDAAFTNSVREEVNQDQSLFRPIDSRDHLVKMFVFLPEDKSAAVMRASAVFDTTPEECVAMETEKESRAIMKKDEYLEKSILHLNAHSYVYHVVVDLGVPGFTPREFLTLVVWRKEGDCFNLYYGPTEHDNFPQTGKWLRGRSNCMFAFKQIEDAGGTPQTLVTMTQKVELAGNIPRFLLESDDKAIDNLMYNSRLRLKFDKSLNIDLKNMEDMVVAQAAHSATAVYTDEELEFIKAGESRFDIFEAGAGIEEKGLRSPLARGKVVIGRKAGSAVGWSTTRVRDSPERVLAWYWSWQARCRQYPSDIERVLQTENEHDAYLYVLKKTPAVIANRDFYGRNVWKKTGEGCYVCDKLCNLDVQGGRSIGAALAGSLATNLTACRAVDEWILRYPAMQEMDRLHNAWFRPMMDTLALRLLERVSWGLKSRLYVTAGLSVLDMATDLGMVNLYMKSGQTLAGRALLAMVFLCLGLNLVMVWLQNRKCKDKKIVVKEVMIVLTGLKPGFDAYRAASRTKKHDWQFMDASMEMSFSKGVEMLTESIPGTVLQLVAYMEEKQKNADYISYQALVSMVLSALTAGFTSATISFDWDTDPKRRKNQPSFYGYVPDRSAARTAIFVCLTLNSTLLLLLRSAGVALLFAADKGYYVVYYFAADMSVYMLVKAARGDLYYWMKFGKNKVSMLIFAVFLRSTIKLVGEFTGIVQFRAPSESGGLHWTVSMLIAVLSPFLAVHVYSREGGTAVPVDFCWKLLALLSGMWVAVFMLFVATMKSTYRKTFFSTQTSADVLKEVFQTTTKDELKIRILGKNRVIWKAMEGEVGAWLADNWERWEEEKPAWFGEAWILGIDEDLLPPEVLRDLKMKKGAGRRRPSTGDRVRIMGRDAVEKVDFDDRKYEKGGGGGGGVETE
ncbi:hypothetical protein TeGR_g897, partial [Tetraparma gracilis]